MKHGERAHGPKWGVRLVMQIGRGPSVGSVVRPTIGAVEAGPVLEETALLDTVGGDTVTQTVFDQYLFGYPFGLPANVKGNRISSLYKNMI